MGVHVHARRIHLEIQHVGGLAAVIEHVAVGEAHRARDELVAQWSAVQEEVLLVRLAACVGRHAEPAVQPQTRALVIKLQRVRDELLAEHGRDAGILRALIPRRRMIGERAARRGEPEPYVEAAQRESLDQPLDLAELGPLGAQELAPRGHVEEEVTHLDRRPGRMRLRRRPAERAVHHRHRGRDLCVRGPRDNRRVRHRGDARQRLATETERAHGLEILDAADLAGGVTREREREFVRGDAGAVVAHAAQLRPAALDFDVDRACAGIEAVLDQFLDHGRGALDDLARRDLVDQLLGKDPDGHGRRRPRTVAARIAKANGSRREGSPPREWTAASA